MASEIKHDMEHYSILGVEGWIVEEIQKRNIVDQILWVADKDAIHMANRLSQEEGLFCGISGGANVLVSFSIAQNMKKGETVVTILPDNRYRYFASEHFTT